MSDLKENTIPILTNSDQPDGERGMFPSPPRIAAKIVEIQSDVVAENIKTVISRVTNIFDNVADSASEFTADSVEIALAISGSGKVVLIGGVSLEANSSIKVTLKRRSKVPT